MAAKVPDHASLPLASLEETLRRDKEEAARRLPQPQCRHHWKQFERYLGRRWCNRCGSLEPQVGR